MLHVQPRCRQLLSYCIQATEHGPCPCRHATVPTRLCCARSNEKGEKGVS